MKTMKVSLAVIITILTVLFTATASQHLFEALLQRRAKPIRWKWKNELDSLIKPPEVQRQRRFLREPSMEKWWRAMAPPKAIKSDPDTTRENLEETVFRKPFFTTTSRTEHLTSREHQNAAVMNKTNFFEEEVNLPEKELPLNVFQSFSLPVDPFGKDNRVIIVTDFLSPTEKSYFNEQNYPDTFGDIQTISEQKDAESEIYETEDIENPTPPEHVDDGDGGEFLHEAIIHEHHKPTKFEIHSASERLKDSQKDFENSLKTISSVEYIVPSVEHVVSEVEYVNNKSDVEEKQVSDVLPSVEYVTPTVEFVEPEVDYNLSEFNSSDSREDFIEKEDQRGDDSENFNEESFSPETNFEQQNLKNKGIETENEGKIFQIVALRRQQIRVRRNHKRHNQIGIPELDYPTLEALPVVQFYCGDYMPGYYVDITTRCQVFHLCDENGQRSSFLCPVGTIFNQKYLVCDWWYNVDCEDSSKYMNSETLQAYSTTNEKQKIATNITPVQKVFISTKLEYEKSYDLNRNVNKNEDYNQKKTSSLSQKAVTYPMGYAILLREYMKNSAGNYKTNKNKNNFQRNDKEDIRNIEFNFEKMSTSSTNKETKKYITPKKPYSKIVQYPTKKTHSPTTHPNNRNLPKLYVNVSLSHVQNKNREQNKYLKTENKYSLYRDKSYSPSLNVNADNSKSIFRNSEQKKSGGKTKESLVEKENKNFDSIIRKTFQDLHENTHANSKHIFKSTKDINRYHFIIDPKEAIKPALGTQFSMSEKQLKNDSTIKFRHAESTLKHIKPYIIKPSPIKNTPNNSKDFIKLKEFSHVEYNSPTDFLDDHLILNSAPRVLKTSNPTQNSNFRYGDRLSKHIRSISFFSEKVNPPIEYYLAAYNQQNQIYSNKTSQKQRNNNTYLSELQQSKSRFDFPNFNNSNISKSSKEYKLKSGNMTVNSYIKRNASIGDSLTNKITISVHIESKAAIKNNGSILLNKHIPTNLSNNNTFFNAPSYNQSSLFTLNPQYNHNKGSSGNIESQENLCKTACKLNLKNITKANNHHGGYFVQETDYKGTDAASNNHNTNKAQERTLNETMWNMPFFSVF